MSTPSNRSLEKEQLKIKRAIIIVVSLLLIFIIGLSSMLVSRYFERKQSKALIYGVWDEQNVPLYIRESFEVREEGIYVLERIVDTRYEFDGTTLRYNYDDKNYVYKVTGTEVIELHRVKPFHYESFFRMRGKEYPKQEDVASK